MDTLEFDYEHSGTLTGPQPVVWRGKTPQDLYRERYSEHFLEKYQTAPKSLSRDVQTCDSFLVRGKGELKGSGPIKAFLIPIPEKP